VSRRVLIALVTSLCLAAAVAIAIVLTIDGDETASRVGFTAFALLLFGLAAVAGIAAIDRPGGRWVGVACTAVSLAGFVVTTVLIWSTDIDGESSDGLAKAFGSLSIGALALAQVSLLQRRVEPPNRWVVLGAQVAAFVLAGLLIGAILGEIADEAYWRWVGVGSALWLLASALVPLSRRLAATTR